MWTDKWTELDDFLKCCNNKIVYFMLTFLFNLDHWNQMKTLDFQVFLF